MVVRFVCVIRVPVCARVSRFVSRLCSGSRPQAAAPRCLFTGKGAVDSGLAAVLAAVESVAVFVRVCDFGFGWMVVRFIRVIRLPACAVPCVSCVSRLPPVRVIRFTGARYSTVHVLKWEVA